MLDSETKRRIDTARDILVGKVPDPKSQVEQITIALIYKFMDDLDAQSEELGGKRTFFGGDFNRYAWAKLMSPGIGGHETLNLYAEAITRMPENPGIPPLFRDIFNNAYLPYRDPETLRAFLKVINEFTYDHSERLGDAFEYLLSVLGAQGDAGQFRTPRHIIDFIVSIVDPKKGESILDPACGTAGFLISAYKHILAANTDEHGRSTLTPEDRDRLVSNFKGYDISPDMVRLSLVNMYLHGFVEPKISEYDTLTSDERWNEFADVILANPPFMSPKGGIRPHNRFSIQSKRSEVLFVDYMAEHLNANGRAGVIVPEGIIFQGQNAHKRLRKMLVETCLVAVVSLPAGVFKPYSGVKTSILLLDKSLARKTDKVAFFKVENDGFDLGDQRRPIEANDLPQTARAVREWLDGLRSEQGSMLREETVVYRAGPGDHSMANFLVLKDRIAADGEYNLSGERYREKTLHHLSKWPMVQVGSICKEILSGGTPSTNNEDFWAGSIPWITSADIVDIKTAAPRRHITTDAIATTATNLIPKGNVIVVTRVGLGKLFRNDFDVCISQDSQGLILKDSVDADYLVYVLQRSVAAFKEVSQGSTIKGVTKKQLANLSIPLPPLPVQREIVEEIEGYQKVINGARAVVDNYRPHIVVDPEWPLVAVGKVAKQIKTGFACGTAKSQSHGVPHIRPMNITEDGQFTWNGVKHISAEEYQGREEYALLAGDVLFNNTNSKELVGKTCLIVEPINGGYSNHMTRLRVLDDQCVPSFLAHILHTAWRKGEFIERANRWVGQAGINIDSLSKFAVPLPPLPTQKAIVAEIEAEQEIVNANRELITRFEKKIEGWWVGCGGVLVRLVGTRQEVRGSCADFDVSRFSLHYPSPHRLDRREDA